jgi:hypothetical protein
MKMWQRDLLDHLALFAMFNANEPRSEDEMRDELKREFSPFLNGGELVRRSS